MRKVLFGATATVWAWLLIAPAYAAGDGEKVGENIGNLLGGWAKSLYVGIAAVVALMFLLNRQFADLAVFMVRGADRGRVRDGARTTSPARSATSGRRSRADGASGWSSAPTGACSRSTGGSTASTAGRCRSRAACRCARSATSPRRCWR